MGVENGMDSTVHAAGLHWVDWLLIGAYVVIVLLLGAYFARRQTSMDEYYTGGRKMPSGLIGISLFVTLMSSISYLANPGEVIMHGPMMTFRILHIPFAYVIVGYLLIPVLMRQRVTSAYELLEIRLGGGVRMLAATMFIVLRLIWMAVMLHITSTALAVVLGVGETWVPAIAAISGMIAVVYTSVGGLRTVVWTDLFQFVCLFLGAVLTVGIISVRMGGFGWWPTSWAPTWDVQPLFSLDPYVRVTLVGTIVNSFVWAVSTAGGDQTAIQRFMATTDASTVRRSYLIHSLAFGCVALLLATVGFSLLGYFRANPELLPPGTDVYKDGDKIFPLFIARHLPTGVTGLVVAAILAAAMSSIDSAVNSITAVVQIDFLDRAGWQPRTEQGHLRFAKGLALGMGATMVAGSSVIGYVPGNFLEMTARTTELLVPHIFALFVMALFVPRATRSGTLAGCVCGVATSVLVAYWNPITGYPPLSFQWISPTALVVNLAVACAVSYTWGRKGNR